MRHRRKGRCGKRRWRQRFIAAVILIACANGHHVLGLAQSFRLHAPNVRKRRLSSDPIRNVLHLATRVVWKSSLISHRSAAFSTNPLRSRVLRAVNDSVEGTADSEEEGDVVVGSGATHSMDTALCIVPPDNAWDIIQRARHLARDDTFYSWPPTIRLFHPFVPRKELTEWVAQAVADFVEQNQLEPFSVTFDQLFIVPHMEELQEKMEEASLLPHQEALAVEQNIDDYEEYPGQRELERQQLANTKRWKQKLSRRRRARAASDLQPQQQHQEEASGGDENDTSFQAATTNSLNRKTTPLEVWKQQQRQKKEYNGPCVVCLEPDQESKRRLLQLREALRCQLFSRYDLFSVSSTVSRPTTSFPTSLKQKGTGKTFRPCVTLGRFPSVSKAWELVTRLQKSLDPISFDVTDFHAISRESAKEVETTTAAATSSPSETDSLFDRKTQFGCDAMVMLIGTEEPDEEYLAQHLARVMLQQDVAEGQSVSVETTLAVQELLWKDYDDDNDDDENEEEYDDENKDGLAGGSTEELEEWLAEVDDDWDDGDTVVDGRVVYFSGEMRQYVGMPASSTTDGKATILGEGVSGIARRRGSVHRLPDRWEDGDFGQKARDNLP